MGHIAVTNLGKAYKQYPTRWSRLAEWMIPYSKLRHQLHWVLQDINFTVNPGEAVGIIGLNGAGKSTLLKMITGTTQPTTGTVEMTGRVAAMLELGMGFHPDFTGRQNAFMAGQLLGYSVEDIASLMPEIEAFAEIGDYIDQPVRVYSSGMQMRLAFSVATAHRPDILIVDEALSVGDAYFQHKSFARIREFREQGTTLLIVSHDKSAIQAICDRAILLSAGQLLIQGKPEAVMDYYNAMLAEDSNQMVCQQAIADGKVQTVSGTGEARIIDVALLNEKNERIDIINVGQKVCLHIITDICTNLPELVLGYVIKDRLGQDIYGTNTWHSNHILKSLKSGQRFEYSIFFPMNIGEGSYSITIALSSSYNHLANNYQWIDAALIFNIVNQNKIKFIGCSWIEPIIKIEPIIELEMSDD